MADRRFFPSLDYYRRVTYVINLSAVMYNTLAYAPNSRLRCQEVNSGDYLVLACHSGS